MELIDDFRKKYPRYWSVWLNAISILLALAEFVNSLDQVLPSMQNTLKPGTFAIASAVVAFAGLVARAIKQSGLAEDQPGQGNGNPRP